MFQSRLTVRVVGGAILVLAGFVARDAMAPPEVDAQVSSQQEEQLGVYEVTYLGNDGVWVKEQFERCRFSVDGGALIISNPFTDTLLKAYSAPVWIAVREVLPQ
ncbi:MAG: hypothetical protein WD873_04135 [Candidatus Hydrogenedentales bacterium]